MSHRADADLKEKMEANEFVTGEVVLSINGSPLKMEMTVPAAPVKPHRMLPVFQKMTNAFVEASALTAGALGSTISCRAGCGACCRQPVPLAEIEIYHLAELVESMPEPRRTEIKRRFGEAAEHFASMSWFERVHKIGLLTLTGAHALAGERLQQATLDYFAEGVPCPFLEDESCSIHENRPLACREYLVTSPAINCSSPTPENISRVPIPISPSSILWYLGKTGKFQGFIPLIRALEFAERYPENFEEKTGERWAADFFGQLTNQTIPEPDDLKTGKSGSSDLPRSQKKGQK